jgi:hypothetical protein
MDTYPMLEAWVVMDTYPMLEAWVVMWARS